MIKDENISKYGRVTTNTTLLKESVIKNCTGKQSYHCQTALSLLASSHMAILPEKASGEWAALTGFKKL